MENKKMWQALIRQMVIELVFLTLFYLYVGNNFGNNFIEWVLRKKGGLALLQRLINRWFSTSSHWFILLIKGLLGICLSVPFSILFGLFVFSSFWIPLAITALICLDRTRKSVLNEFLGEPSDVAIQNNLSGSLEMHLRMEAMPLYRRKRKKEILKHFCILVKMHSTIYTLL